MDKDEAFRKLAELISRLHQVEDSLMNEVKNEDLTDLQQHMLTVLFFSGPKNLSSLSSCLNINLPNCSREVKRLAGKGLLSKGTSRDDKRVILINLSDEGFALVRRFFMQMENLYFQRSGDWSEGRSERLIKALDVIQSEIDLYEG